MAAAHAVGGVPTVRVASSLHLATTFFPCSSYRRRRRGSAGPTPPAMTADVRVVVRRHFPAAVVAAGPCGGCGGARTVEIEKVADDITLRRRPARKLRGPEQVERALAEDVLPLVRHRFDRGSVAAARGEICAYVSAACADARLAHGGVHVLVVVDTFACPGVVLRAAAPPCNKPMMMIIKMTPSGGVPKILDVNVTRADDPACVELKSGTPAKETTRRSSVGVIGDGRRPKPVEERFKGWLPW